MKTADPSASSSSRLRWLVVSTVLMISACGASGEEGRPSEGPGGFPQDLLPDRLVPDLPLVPPESDLDVPVFSDIVHVEAGADATFCTYTNVIVDEPTIFGESFGAQSPQGHHAILQYATTPQEPHTGSCGQMDGQMLLGGTGGKGIADEPTLPVNFGVEVPAGAQLVINHHWINTSTEPVEGQSMMLARRLVRGGDTVLAGTMIMLGLGWEIPARSPLEFTTECKYDSDIPYVRAIGHMHEWGQNVRIDVERAEGEAETLINEVWTPESATGVGGGRTFTLDDTFEIQKGDTVRLTCSWNNTGAEPIGFPREMCIFFGYTVGSSYVCANGAWLTSEAAKAAGMGDVGSHL